MLIMIYFQWWWQWPLCWQKKTYQYWCWWWIITATKISIFHCCCSLLFWFSFSQIMCAMMMMMICNRYATGIRQTNKSQPTNRWNTQCNKITIFMQPPPPLCREPRWSIKMFFFQSNYQLPTKIPPRIDPPPLSLLSPVVEARL